MSTGEQILRANTGVQEPLLTNQKNSLFKYQGWMAYSSHAPAWTNLDPHLDGPRRTEFRITKLGDMAGKLQLMYKFEAKTGGNGDTFARLANYAGYVAIEKVDIIYNTNQIQTIPQEQLFVEHKTHYTNEEKVAKNELTISELADADRDLLAGSVTEVIVDIPVAWSHDPKTYLSIVALAHEVRVIVYWAAPHTYIQTDNPDPSTPVVFNRVDTVLKLYTATLLGIERQMKMQETGTGDGRLFKSTDVQLVRREIIPNGSTASNWIKIPLKAFTLASYALSFYIRPASSVEGTQAQIDPFGNLQLISEYQLVANNNVIMGPFEDKYGRFHLNSLFWPAQAGTAVYTIPFATDLMHSKLHACGHYNFGHANNAQLWIRLYANNLPAENWYVDVLSWIHNTYQQKAGDLITSFK